MKILSFTVAIALAAFALLPTAASARIYTVGADFACTHRSIQSALDAASRRAGHDIVRLARNQRHRLDATTSLGTNVSIEGGYSNCGDDSALGVTSVTVTSRDFAETLASSRRVRNLRIEAREEPRDALAGRTPASNP